MNGRPEPWLNILEPTTWPPLPIANGIPPLNPGSAPMSIAWPAPMSQTIGTLRAALLGSMPMPATRPESLTPKAVVKKSPLDVVAVMTLPVPPLYIAPRCRLPPLTEPTATPDELTSNASPSVSPAGSGSCDTAPFCQIVGRRLEPNAVVAHVPTIKPLSVAASERQKLRAARFGSPTIPPPPVYENACAPVFPLWNERPTAMPPGETPSPCEAVSVGSTTPISKI